MEKQITTTQTQESETSGKKRRTPVTIFNQGRVFFILCLALLFFAALVATAVFFLSVRGAEEVMVPDVRGKDIIPALLELQNKELDARIQLRYASASRGGIIEQEPRAGTIVKAGRKIRLVVSQGALLSNVGYYTGRKVDEVRSELAAIFGSSEPPLITIKDPLLYQFSPEPIGTILEQDPLPGAGVSEPVELALIVSKGPESEQVEMPLLTGLRLDKALELAGKSGIRWVLSSRPLKSGENSETVVEQEPAGGELIAVNRVASITVAEPDVFDLKNNEVAALFEYTLPENPYPMATTLEVIPPEGPRRTLVNVSHYGGRFTYPYRLTRGSILVLSLLNRELYRETVQ